jgi:hypothetical protein
MKQLHASETGRTTTVLGTGLLRGNQGIKRLNASFINSLYGHLEVTTKLFAVH